MTEALAVPALTRPSRFYSRPVTEQRRRREEFRDLSEYNREEREQRILALIASVQESPEERRLREIGQNGGRRKGKPINLKPTLLRLLAAGPMPLREIVAACAVGRSTVGNCLARSPWFTRLRLGIWTLTDEGHKELEEQQ